MSDDPHNEKKNDVKRELFTEKKFKIRNSPLIDKYENNADINAIYNLFLVILIGLITTTIISDYAQSGQVNFGFRSISINFNRFYWVILIWIILILKSYLIFYVFQIWVLLQESVSPKHYKLWNITSATLLISYEIFVLYLIQTIIQALNLNPGSAGCLVGETLRLLMKEHAFIRNNARRIAKQKQTDPKLMQSTINHYIYFLFAPTLIFCDHYPRTNRIRWKFVFYNLFEVTLIVYFLYLIVERFLIPTYKDFGLRKFRLDEIIIPVLTNLFPGILFLLAGFYSVLHATQNAFAEMLRFGDRMFYKEWWTSKSLSEYFRTWNVLVHEWLFTYIYRDFYEIIVPKNRFVAKLAVFTLSAIIHEWIMSVVLNLFLPINFIEFFIVGVLFSCLNIVDYKFGNFAVWYSLVLGAGMQVNLYALEYAARINCQLSDDSTAFDFYKPRFLACGSIK